VQLGWNQQEDRVSHDLRRGIAEDSLGGSVPGENGPVERLAHDRVIGRLDDRGEPGGRNSCGPVRVGNVRIQIGQAQLAVIGCGSSEN
jgi:hypothetical protein